MAATLNYIQFCLLFHMKVLEFYLGHRNVYNEVGENQEPSGLPVVRYWSAAINMRAR